jgi:hypothetical protein
MKSKRSKTNKRGGKTNQRGCGKCNRTRCNGKCNSNRTRCRHRKQRGGCGTCVIGGGQKGGSAGFLDNIQGVSGGISTTFMNMFRGFSGQPAILIPPF